jgi:hypothetical protein
VGFGLRQVRVAQLLEALYDSSEQGRRIACDIG